MLNICLLLFPIIVIYQSTNSTLITEKYATVEFIVPQRADIINNTKPLESWSTLNTFSRFLLNMEMVSLMGSSIHSSYRSSVFIFSHFIQSFTNISLSYSTIDSFLRVSYARKPFLAASEYIPVTSRSKTFISSTFLLQINQISFAATRTVVESRLSNAKRENRPRSKRLATEGGS